MRVAIALLCTFVLGGGHANAFAWGAEGHEVVALIAERRLTPQARLQVDALLVLRPGTTLASISNWADFTRNNTTARWHYVNLPRESACQYLPSRDCPDDECVVAAIDIQVQRLASRASPSETAQCAQVRRAFRPRCAPATSCWLCRQPGRQRVPAAGLRQSVEVFSAQRAT